MTDIMTFKKPSKINFQVKIRSESKRPMLDQAVRGDTFLREGAICMRVEVSAYQALKLLTTDEAETVKDILVDRLLWIINLQTGRVFISENVPVEWIKLTVDVEGEL